MIRARFKVPLDDPRPISWPIKHPYWITGYSTVGDNLISILVAYADDKKKILDLWPEAEEIDIEDVSEYVFTSRFARPDWFEATE